MQTAHTYWYSPRLGHDMGVAVFGHWGPPLLAFPTSHGDEWELERHDLIDAIGEFIDAGRVKMFCVGSNNHESFLNSGAHPFHRSWRQRMFDEYIRDEVIPFIHSQLPDDRHPDRDARGVARRLSRRQHALPLSAPGEALLRAVGRLRSARTSWTACTTTTSTSTTRSTTWRTSAIRGISSSSRPARSRLVTGTGPVEKSAYSYPMSGILAKRIRHHLDDWGPRGGHDWPYWKVQVREYLSRW